MCEFSSILILIFSAFGKYISKIFLKFKIADYKINGYVCFMYEMVNMKHI